MNNSLIRGLHAAVLTPRDSQGKLDESALARQLEFLLTNRVCKFLFNGATGEYCLSTSTDVNRCLQIARAILPTEASFLCGIGAAGLHETLALCTVAVEGGATGLLLPAPYFFPYDQQDLLAFVRAVAANVRLPILLYNLPRFTTGFTTATSVELIKECAEVVGIKDSSGSLDTLRALTREGIAAARMIGNDSALAQALVEDVCDGVVSGVACVAPELILPLFANPPGNETFQRAAERLRQFISKVDVLPAPWGVKVIAEARGIAKASYALPLSAQRETQIREIQDWFNEWIYETMEPVADAHT
jgi:4-hydroxy-tetrahydrodipicolinate synthase